MYSLIQKIYKYKHSKYTKSIQEVLVMNKKGSMELSVNSIVILVIAIVMLGLILGFVNKNFNTINKQFSQDEPAAPPASSSDPISISRAAPTVNAGEQLSLRFNIYALANISMIDKPSINCGTSTFTLSANGKLAKLGDNVEYQAIVNVPTTLAKGKTLCSLGFTASGGDGTNSPIIPYKYQSKDLIITVQ